MSDSKNTRIFSVIAAVCAILTGIFTILYCIMLKSEGLTFEDFFSDRFHFWWAGYGVVKPMQLILSGILYFLLAIILLIEKKNIGYLIAVGLLGLSGVFDAYQYIQAWHKSGMDIQHLLCILFHVFLILAYAFLFVLSLLHTIPSTKEKAGKMSVLHFVPAGLFFIGKVSALLGYSCEIMIGGTTWTKTFTGFGEKLYFWHWEGKEWLGFGLLPAAGIGMMVLIGLWLMKSAAPVKTANILGQADKLKTYKELMDAEMITQEEFEEKKKEILAE